MSNIFNPNNTAIKGKTIFGFPHSQKEARIVVYPVPFDVTTSYKPGTSQIRNSLIEASSQIDLMAFSTPEIFDEGIHITENNNEIEELNKELRPIAESVITALENGEDIKLNPKLVKGIEAVNKGSHRVNEIVYEETKKIIENDQLVILLGGDHSTNYGYIKALSEQTNFGILQLDAHMDLRVAYQGFEFSHASIMNKVTELNAVNRLVQVGVRDYCDDEFQVEKNSKGRIKTFYDQDLKAQQFLGKTWQSSVKKIVNALPETVYISFDIDGLDPTLCPSTGTPVPGGLSFDESLYLLDALVASGRKIIGCDLVEVAPSTSKWDENVASRLLFQMACLFLETKL